MRYEKEQNSTILSQYFAIEFPCFHQHKTSPTIVSLTQTRKQGLQTKISNGAKEKHKMGGKKVI
tara:strand:- start:128 stop:319 length:192 start_codon:yes stop_codon:yes gene_type:complete